MLAFAAQSAAADLEDLAELLTITGRLCRTGGVTQAEERPRETVSGLPRLSDGRRQSCAFRRTELISRVASRDRCSSRATHSTQRSRCP